MDEKRAQTLEALSTFIESQKALLARTQSDIERLATLREDIATTSAETCSFDYFNEQVQAFEGLRLSELDGVAPDIHKEVEWSLFSSADPTPLRSLATRLKDTYARQRQPSTKQTAPLSALQALVKSARVTIIDPVLMSFPELSEDEEDEPPDPEELRRIQEREKIRELKRRRIHGDAGMYGLSGLALRRPGAEAVFVRRDVEDESAEVDISLDDAEERRPAEGSASTATPSSAVDLDMDVDTPATSVVASPHSSHGGKHLPTLLAATASRSRRSTAKASSRAQTTKNSSGKNRPAPAAEPKTEDAEEQEPKLNKKGKPRPETYKQAWSVEEQHLLERLLEEIPDGEKNRWSKISQAMNGRRTARQVASRVQKYYEKLKRFGVDVNGSSSRANDS